MEEILQIYLATLIKSPATPQWVPTHSSGMTVVEGPQIKI